MNVQVQQQDMSAALADAMAAWGRARLHSDLDRTPLQAPSMAHSLGQG